jgi:hypothetical protein
MSERDVAFAGMTVILSAIRERPRLKLPYRTTRSRHAMRHPDQRRRLLPADPALWVWAAVALMALVPLTEHAVAARLIHVERAARSAHAAPAAPSPAAPQSTSASGTPTS